MQGFTNLRTYLENVNGIYRERKGMHMLTM